jgi:hypothetical protein
MLDAWLVRLRQTNLCGGNIPTGQNTKMLPTGHNCMRASRI